MKRFIDAVTFWSGIVAIPGFIRLCFGAPSVVELLAFGLAAISLAVLKPISAE